MGKQTVIEAGFYNGRFLTPGEVYENTPVTGNDVDTRSPSPVIPADASQPAPRTESDIIDVGAAANAIRPPEEPKPAEAQADQVKKIGR